MIVLTPTLKSFVVLLAVSIFSPMALGGNLQLKISGFRSGKGYAAISVFSEENRSAFPGKSAQAVQSHYVALKGQTEIEIVVMDLAPGNYAVAVMHDEDGDKEMKMSLGIPREGFGFSGNPKIFFGPPSFGRARITIEKDLETAIRIKYLL